MTPSDVPYVSKAAHKRRIAADKARAARAVSKVKADVEECVVDALRGLIKPDGAMATTFVWKDVIGKALRDMEGRGYERAVAAGLIGERLVPRAPAHMDP